MTSPGDPSDEHGVVSNEGLADPAPRQDFRYRKGQIREYTDEEFFVRLREINRKVREAGGLDG